MRITVPRSRGVRTPRPAREPRLRRGARVRAIVLNVFTARLHVMRVAGRRLLMQVDTKLVPGDVVEMDVLGLRPVPRFRLADTGQTLWSLPIGKAKPTTGSIAQG